ncbi:MAG: hypothetical protein ABIQ56_01420 [Chitinophagaceae bacterium]
MGVIAIALSVYFLGKLKQPFYNGMSYSLLAVSLIQLTVGITVYFRSPKDIVRVNLVIQTDKSKIQSEEIPRMKTVMKNFLLYRWIEIALMITGIFLYLYFKSGTIWKGIGLGLLIQAALMLILDLFAENRGKIYLAYLQNLNQH